MPKFLTEDEVRDADKIDIICTQNELSGVFVLNPSYIKPFQEKRLYRNTSVTGQYEVLLRQIAFVYDMNFKYTYRLLLTNGIIDKKIDLLKLFVFKSALFNLILSMYLSLFIIVV